MHFQFSILNFQFTCNLQALITAIRLLFLYAVTFAVPGCYCMLLYAVIFAVKINQYAFKSIRYAKMQKKVAVLSALTFFLAVPGGWG